MTSRMARHRRIYHRIESPTQTREIAGRQAETSEIWGTMARYAHKPCVRAYKGPLPEGSRGVEFTTDVKPDRNSPPGQAYWRGPREGVIVDGEFAKIRVTILRNTQS